MAKPGVTCFREPKASELKRLRIKARRKRRLTYDCLAAIVGGDSVCCRKGHKFGRVGGRSREGMSLLSVLRGVSSSACQNCLDFNGEVSE